MATILGTSGNDVITGGIGNDKLNGLAGADIMSGGLGHDTYYIDNLGDTPVELPGAGTDTIISTVAVGAKDNIENYDFSKVKTGFQFLGNALHNIIISGAGADTLVGGLGNDTYYLNSGKDVVVEVPAGGTNDTIAVTFSADLADYANVENIRLLGSAALNATGGAGINALEGNSGANKLDGKGGADIMLGGKGNDTYYVDHTGDLVIEYAGEGIDTVVSSVDFTLAANVENLTLAAGAGSIGGTGNGQNNVIVGNESGNFLSGQGGADTMKGGKGDDSYVVDHAGDKIVENANEGIDLVYSAVDFSLASLAHVEHLYLEGGAIKATGNALGNIIYGNAQHNVIDGGKGADEMRGGAGNDTYYVDNAGDAVLELGNDGIDTIVSTVAFDQAVANVENYDFSKLTKGFSFTGNDLDNVIKSGAGIDTLAGGAGNDTYYLNSAKDKVTETAGQGNDTIATTFSANLLDYLNVENIRLIGTAALKATGNSAANVLEGNAGANILDGKGGADTMRGGKGNDTYYVDNTGDMVIENAKEGTDTVISSVTYELDDNVENLTLAPGAGNIYGIGNSLNNLLIGNEGANILGGGGGADTLRGGKGNDLYYVDDVKDKVIENANEGDDWVASTVDFSLASLVHVENLMLQGNAIKGTGNAKSNQIYGNDQDNIIDGGAGADHMEGGLGNDTYHVNHLADSVMENAGEGIDTIISTVALVGAVANVENYDFSKLKTGINFTGTSAANVLKGGAGVDTLAGGLGSDTYYLNSAKDVVIEDAGAGQGIDTIVTTFTADLANYANVEQVRLTGKAALNAYGTGDGNALVGNDGANILDGRGGADFMAGGKGNDTYYVDDIGDTVSESAGEGVDTVVATVSHELQNNVENLVLAAGAGSTQGYGNSLANVIIGNEGSNNLDGKGGADTMRGGKGDDFYFVDHAGDKVIESADEGNDSVFSKVDFSLAALAHVENLYLQGAAIKATGNGRANYLYGNGEDNIIDGGKGADIMLGAAGDDTYHVDDLGDIVHENSGEGNDTIVATVALGNATAHVENYDFSKLKSGIHFIGNDSDNIIKGGAGIDTLAGGLGNDTYYLNSAKDVVQETFNPFGGIDTVAVTFNASLEDYTYVENITLLGKAALNATGNDEDNVLTGNDAANKLDGRLGQDTLIGGKGNDTYYVDHPWDVVVELANEGTDTVVSYVNYTLSDHVENLTLLGAFGKNGTGNTLNNLIVGNDNDNVLDGKAGADTMTGGKGDDTYYVDHAGDKVIELAGQGHDTVRAAASFSLAAHANVEDLYLEGTAKNGTGNALGNLIVGNGFDNILDGSKGADTMRGGLGGDTYYVDNLGDLVEELAGGGYDKVVSTVALSNGFANVEEYDFTRSTTAVNFTGTNDDERIRSSRFSDTLAGGKGSDHYLLDNAGDRIVELAGDGYDSAYVSFSVTKLWDNVEVVAHVDTASTKAWNATGNDLDNTIFGNDGNNALNGGLGDDVLFGYGGNDTLTGGAGEDRFCFFGVGLGQPLLGHDVIADFDQDLDILYVSTADSDGNGSLDANDVVAGIVDQGAGKNVVVHLLNGGSITFAGAGTGAVDSLDDLVANPASQIVIP